jgi:hypothetical protein
MYVKTTSRKTKDGTEVRYLHLAHNQWDPARHRSVPQVLFSFGREDALDRDAIQRLVASLSRLLDPADALAATAGSDLVFAESRPAGGVHVLDALWRRLNIDEIIRGAGQNTRGRPAGRSRRRRNWPPRTGSAMMFISLICPPPPMTPATGRWTGCIRSAARWRKRSTIRSPIC